MLAVIKKVPFIRFLIPFIFGILLSDVINFRNEIVIYLLIGTALIAILEGFKNRHFSKQYIFGFFLSLFLIVLGVYCHSNYNKAAFILEDKKDNFIAVANEFPIEKNKSYKVEVKLVRKLTDSLAFQYGEKAILYLEKDTCVLDIKPGSILIFESDLQVIRNLNNPFEFDIRNYYNAQKIYYQSYIPKEKLVIEEGELSLMHRVMIFRNSLVEKYQKQNLNGNRLAILSALTLGDKNLLDPDTKSAFIKSGSMHLLAVSGLHVGIIYLILIWLFTKLLFKIPIPLQVIIILLFLWFYAALTGFSPSVKRATIMFTFFAIGRLNKYAFNTYNLIAASAFFILLFNPNSIFMVGFQLSYLAVLSIMYFQPKIGKLIYIENKIVKYIWDLTSVSIAAQIGTLAISIYYFHQFPVFFWLSNILIIPIAPFLIYFSVLLFIFYPYGIISTGIAKLLNLLLSYLEWVTNTISQFDFSILDNLLLLKSQVVIIYLLILVLIVYSVKKRWHFLNISFLLIAAFLSLHSWNTINKANQVELVIANSNKIHISYLKNAKQTLILGDQSLAEMERINANYKLQRGVKDPVIINYRDSVNASELYMRNGVIQLNTIRIVVLDKLQNVHVDSTNKLKTDYIYLTNQYIEIEDIIDHYDFSTIILPFYFYDNKKTSIKKVCVRNKINYHSLEEQGSLIINLDRF